MNSSSDSETETASSPIQENKKQQNPRVYEKFKCTLCNGTYTLYNKSKHEKTLKHQKYLPSTQDATTQTVVENNTLENK